MKKKNRESFLKQIFGNFLNKNISNSEEPEILNESYSKFLFLEAPLPICIIVEIDEEDILLYSNKKFENIFKDFTIYKTKKYDIEAEAKKHEFEIKEISDIFGGEKITILFLNDKSENFKYEKILRKTRQEILYVSVDNYDELITKTKESKKSEISTQIETKIREFATYNKAAVIRYKIDIYLVIISRVKLQKICKEKFIFLENIKNIETETEIPVTLSIGGEISDGTPNVKSKIAEEALNLAKGRGGDQAVINNLGKEEFYGATSQFIGSRNKGRSRVVSYALSKLIEKSSKVYIESHKNMDFDAFASAVGVARIVRNNKRNPQIILNEVSDELKPAIEKMRAENQDIFIKSKDMPYELNDDDLIIVVDTHLSSLVENYEVIKKANMTVIIDHHIRKSDSIQNATLSLIDPLSSSTSELVTEILGYDKYTKSIPKNEAEYLLAGIIVDTNKFAIKTGRRTYEAAAILREAGADGSIVTRMLQESEEEVKFISDIIKKTEISSDGIAIATILDLPKNMNRTPPKIVDRLLEIKGVRASFIFYRQKNETWINARSLGEVNVQKLMEEFGGGGHFLTAAAQIKDDNIECIIKKLKEKI